MHKWHRSNTLFLISFLKLAHQRAQVFKKIITAPHYRTPKQNFQHLEFVCRTALPVGVFVSGLWLVIFAFMQNWPLVVIEFVLFAMILGGWLAALRGYISQGMLVSQVACVIFIVSFSLLFDVPSEAVPRVAHIYLLIIALAGFVNHQLDPSRFQLGVILTSIACFVLFSASTMQYEFATPLSDDIRSVTAWVHAGLSVFLLCGGILLIQRKLGPDSRYARDLRLALAKDQFELFFQPQVDGAERLVGAEALLRWRHPRLGYIAPDEFIPVAERSGLMPHLGGWVLDCGIQTLSAWRDQPETSDLVLSINVSPDQLFQENFVSHVLSALAASSVPAHALKLELTETMFVAQVDELISKIKALEKHGIGIALDDFGTGYSSLSYLQQLPLQQLKIDRSFVRAVSSERGARLARNICQMGHDLGLDILAEGIETEEQYRFMLDCGCNAFQGFYFGRPVALDVFKERFLS